MGIGAFKGNSGHHPGLWARPGAGNCSIPWASRFSIIPSTVDEPPAVAGETPGGYALRMARLKTRDVAWGHPGSFVLGADTVVAVGECSSWASPRTWKTPSGCWPCSPGANTPWVTGCVLIGPDGQTVWEEAVASKVTFARLQEEAIAAYVATGEPMDKAGGYAIQGLGAFMIARVDGSYTNVVGLPLAEDGAHLPDANHDSPPGCRGGPRRS